MPNLSGSCATISILPIERAARGSGGEGVRVVSWLARRWRSCLVASHVASLSRLNILTSQLHGFIVLPMSGCVWVQYHRLSKQPPLQNAVFTSDCLDCCVPASLSVVCSPHLILNRISALALNP